MIVTWTFIKAIFDGTIRSIRSALWKVTRSIRPEMSSVMALRSGTVAFIWLGSSLSHGWHAMNARVETGRNAR